MRKDWFDHVAKTRKKMSRGKKGQVSHVAAMKEASVTWPKVKQKLLRKKAREEKKLAREKAKENC